MMEEGGASIYDAPVPGLALGSSMSKPIVETDYEKLKKKLGVITCLALTLAMFISFTAVSLLYLNQPASSTVQSTDIGTWKGTGGSTASIKICTRNQAFLVWINGHLVGTGQECDLEFLKDHRAGAVTSRKNVQIDAPCDMPLMVAIEAQDFEFGDPGEDKQSKAGIVAEITWCGTKILTGVPSEADRNRTQWNCSTSAPSMWMQPCNSTAVHDCGAERTFYKALSEVHHSGEAHCPKEPQTDCSDDKQARDQKISETAEWVWAASSDYTQSSGYTPQDPRVQQDLKNIDSAYCRAQVDCAKHQCKAPITSGGCTGPGPIGAPGYLFDQEDGSVHYTRPPTAPDGTEGLKRLFDKDELGKVTCSAAAGYAQAREIDKICNPPPDGTPGRWEFDGCCADFVWSIPATNYFVAFLAFVLMSYMFIAFHIICDDFFVPALNVMCETVGLSDDIAGATFMAAGASSPELFASLVGVLTNSEVGVGTVVGSELFNMLVIIGGVCLVTPKALQLDWRPLSREVFFFSLSLVLVLWVLNDEEVQTTEALVLLLGYAGYVVVCATFKPLVRIFCPVSGVEGADDAEYYVDFYADENVNIADEDLASLSDASGGIIGTPTAAALKESQSSASGSISGGADLSEGLLQQGDALPGAAFGMDYGEVLAHGFLFLKSSFHSKARLSKGVWQQRWMVMDEQTFRYTRKNGKQRIILSSGDDWAAASVRTTSYTEFELHTPTTDKLVHTFKAVKPLVAKQWVKQLNVNIDKYKNMSPEARGGVAPEHEEGHDHAAPHDILQRPKGCGPAAILFYATFPLLVCFKYTVPDVRYEQYTKWYPATMVISVVWLAFLAEFMMNSAETMGCILAIPEDIMGLTFTAAGTSLPNLFASLIVAKQGLGNMSVSNAFGSNTFNIFIALALPWFIGSVKLGLKDGGANACSAFATIGTCYTYHVKKGHIFFSCEMLGAVLFGIVAMVMSTGFRLTKPLGWPMIIVYGILIVYLCSG